MTALATPLRKDLEKAVVRARRVSEEGAAASLLALGYADRERPGHLSDGDAALRVALRARGRQLGEAQGEAGVQQGQRALTEEIAYEQWHRMLFARFLAENGLLRHPDGATVSLADCAELAEDEGARDGWDLAARYAAAMLPGLFRASDPAVRVRLAREHYVALEGLVEGLHPDVFGSDDGLGWVYQFWQTERKKQVNAEAKSRGTKIGAAELPAVTQLFTEPYMVDFLLQNTLGAWWAGKYPDSPLLAEMPYLRWADEVADPSPSPSPSADGEGSPLASRAAASTTTISKEVTAFAIGSPSPSQRGGGWGEGSALTPRLPAAGTFDGWAKTVAELRVLDPCCGSGHFLVAAFGWLRRMREVEEGLSAGDAADATLRDNLFGLELDRRCTQIAMFNVALAAWRAGGQPERHAPQVACSGTPVRGQLVDWKRVAAGDDALEFYVEKLYEAFSQAPTLGSLIDPRALLYETGLAHREQAVMAGLSRRPAMTTMDMKLFRRSPEQSRTVLDEIARRYATDPDLAIFADSADEVARAATILSARYDLTVTNVPYLSRASQSPDLRDYADRRHGAAKGDLATTFLDRCLGFGAEGGTVAAVTPQNWLFLGAYRKLREDLLVSRTLDLIARLGTGAFETFSGEVVNVALVAVTARGPLPDATFAGIDASAGKAASDKAALLHKGLVAAVSQAAQHDAGTISLLERQRGAKLMDFGRVHYGAKPGQTTRVTRFFWEMPGGETETWSFLESRPETSTEYGGKSEKIYSSAEMNRQSITEYSPSGSAIWGGTGIVISQMRNLPVSLYLGRVFDNNTSVFTPDNALNLPACFSYLSSVEYAEEVRKSNSKMDVAAMSMANVPFDLDHWTKVAAEQYPNGLPEPHSDDPTQWLFTGHPKGSDNPLHVALARLLGYRWPDQPADDHGLGHLADPDGIVCLPAISGEAPAHDRLAALLRAAWGADWSPTTQADLLTGAGSPDRSLEAWLREDAFKQHCALFHNRPFLWHVWDGRKDGFSAFVNYHRLDGALLDKLTYTYLGDWIARQREDARADVAGAQARLDAALDLQARLELIRAGEAPHDIYVRWKPLDRQPLGWEPDLDDGVRLNVRPFVEAGVLRTKFTVKWGKDRGANPAGADVHRWSEAAQRAAENRPADVNGADRLNDLHLSLAVKRAARAAAASAPDPGGSPSRTLLT